VTSALDDGTVVLVIGVAGSGKSTIGAMLARRLGAPFVDGDDLHSVANLRKLAAGIPLDDHDREPWLANIRARITASDPDRGLVVACSALKRRFRDNLRGAGRPLLFVHLTLDRDTATARVAARANHIMPVSLVDAQFRDLEPLGPDEPGITMGSVQPPDEIVAAVLAHLAKRS
jgi:gluconokinase